jgi:peptidoglycan/xylan/chitin deacetylase (PgdA/CDA1 family)
MQACGFAFHSHTINHFDCGSTDEARLRTEIVSARTMLEQKLGRPVDSFSFPWGQGKNMSPPAVALARASYANVFSACNGFNLPAAGRWHFYRSPYPYDTFELELQIQQILQLDPEGPTLPF